MTSGMRATFLATWLASRLGKFVCALVPSGFPSRNPPTSWYSSGRVSATALSKVSRWDSQNLPRASV